MAEIAYLPSSDYKKTIEKAVKEKPKLKDLVKVESPGKPVPATNLETPKKRKKTTAKREPKIGNPKRDSILIITEKPQAANKIANALGNPEKYSENKVPFYELKKGGEKIIVCSAVGHLFNLTYVKGQKGYPIFKTEWVPSYSQSKSAAFTKNYYNLIKKLSRKAKEVIIATDYDNEGEVIGWNVLRFLVKEENAKRMKYSTLTKDELLNSYENASKELNWGHAYGGETRHLVDWLYGINLSRALMAAIKRTGSFRILSIGRVQGPALKVIVDRDKEIKNFKSEPFWQVIALTDKAKGIEFKHPKDIFEKKELKDFENIKETQAKTTKKEETITPPVPFDLTTLQREAHRWHRISPSATLRAAQGLYLEGLISYPRTSSQKIPDQINPKQILKKLESKFPEAKNATRPKPVEGKKTDPAHPSIYPTGDFKKLEKGSDEERIYNLIAKRFISCFSKDAKTANKRIVLTADNGKTFTAHGLVILEKGWANIYPAKFEELDLPDLEGKTKINKIRFDEKETQPPKRYTAASLVSILEKKGLGTKATRSIIVDTLFDRGYLDGKSIEATPLGIKLIEALEKYSPIIIDEKLTKNLEKKVDEIEHAKSGFKEKEKKVIQDVEKIITDICKDFKAREEKIGKELQHGTEELREMQKEQSIIMPCPKCKKGNLMIKYSKKTSRYFAACSEYPDCKETHSLPPNALIKTTEKKSERGLPMLIAIRKGKRPWEFEFNPNWRKEHEKELAQKENS